MKTLLITTAAISLSLSINAQSYADASKPPADAEVMFKTGEAAYRSGDHKGAILYFSEALKANPDHVNAYLQRGFCYSLLKQYANAAADFSSVITRQKDHVWAYISRGSAYNKLEQFDLALNDFNKVLELEPKNEEGYNNRGWAYKGKDDMKSACKDWKTSKKFGNAEAKIILINTGCK
ncbi:MAG: tetratricopeptide repeat protein [Flavobacteriales bacterium]|nr:tetratricopeptide repeat protein [Flavobacteriales bacterium]MBK6945099.1 tetratricopeptide repeat protein [Flavobacteriales bacterium]MBK7239448.1 tetratricopeptide repeat protein [Flavobacteriales bacterium]MBK7295992.1 tetratricopeptide repeat protein [Flavobacteriales bacterium]MBK9535344.1 tetratricopeptide repeat protein [Flavobacteriales bacterium]